jgi:hypothetical protein
MRSSLIFSVSAKFTNRYLLCRMLSASARKVCREGTSPAQSINRALQVLHDSCHPTAPEPGASWNPEGPGKKPASPAAAENSELKEKVVAVAP